MPCYSYPYPTQIFYALVPALSQNKKLTPNNFRAKQKLFCAKIAQDYQYEKDKWSLTLGSQLDIRLLFLCLKDMLELYFNVRSCQEVPQAGRVEEKARDNMILLTLYCKLQFLHMACYTPSPPLRPSVLAQEVGSHKCCGYPGHSFSLPSS
jgi:hypothetical protein